MLRHAFARTPFILVLAALTAIAVSRPGQAQFNNDFYRQQQEQQRRMDEQRRQQEEFWRRQREDQQRREQQQRFMDNLRRQQEEQQRFYQRQQDEFWRRQREDDDARRQRAWQKQQEDQQRLWHESRSRPFAYQAPQGSPSPSTPVPTSKFKSPKLREAEQAVRGDNQARRAAAAGGQSHHVREAEERVRAGSAVAQAAERVRAGSRFEQALRQWQELPETSAAGDRVRQALARPTEAGRRFGRILAESRQEQRRRQGDQ